MWESNDFFILLPFGLLERRRLFKAHAIISAKTRLSASIPAVQLINMRATGEDENAQLTQPTQMLLFQAPEFIDEE